MSSFQETELRAWRLCILRCLDEASGKGMYIGLLEKATRAFLFVYSRDQLRTQLAWLQQQGCVELRDHETASGTATMAKLLRQGHDVATGAVTMPGIDTPSQLD